MQIKYNITPRTNKIKFIVIHDTANKSDGANARAHYNYFNSGNRNSSADCFIDSKEILWVNDFTKYYTWHCGDGKGKNGIINNNSIGIELCINADGDYEKALNNLIDETARIAKMLSISHDHILRHFDVSGKNCPSSMQKNNWEVWKFFKNEVKHKMKVNTFKDIENHYARKHIEKLLNYGIVNGDGNGNFNPDLPLTRADAAIMIANALTVAGK
ncbi:MAG: N-acetylmuramoyl-L-alanine amidase [Clostridia bacterium]|nr:N-acetylmuramoyl-L-alanine amidase [Clostridia bacterium]